MDDHIESSPPQSPKKCRRRSSFFERRQSVIMTPPPLDDSTTTEADLEEARSIRLQEYIEKLSNEKIAWKNYYSEKKKEYDSSFKTLKSNTNEEVTLDSLHALLRNEDKEFLLGKPDMGEIWRECGEACSMSQDLVLMMTRLCEMGARHQEHMLQHQATI